MSIDPRTYTYADNILKDRIVLITGASDGIGKALALHIAGLGAQVILHGRDVKKLEKIYDEVEAIDGAARWQAFWRIILPLLQPTTLFMFVTTMIGGFQVFTEGFVHGPFSFTGSTATPGGELSLVTPVVIRASQPLGTQMAFGRLTVRFVPEPGLLVLLGSGLGGLCVLERRRSLRKRRRSPVVLRRTAHRDHRQQRQDQHQGDLRRDPRDQRPVPEEPGQPQQRLRPAALAAAPRSAPPVRGGRARHEPPGRDRTAGRDRAHCALPH